MAEDVGLSISLEYHSDPRTRSGLVGSGGEGVHRLSRGGNRRQHSGRGGIDPRRSSRASTRRHRDRYEPGVYRRQPPISLSTELARDIHRSEAIPAPTGSSAKVPLMEADRRYTDPNSQTYQYIKQYLNMILMGDPSGVVDGSNRSGSLGPHAPLAPSNRRSTSDPNR